MAFASYATYAAMGNQPCNGGEGVMAIPYGPLDAKPFNAFCLCSKGSGTTVLDLANPDDITPGTLTINDPTTLGTAWNQSGNGYQCLSVRHATAYINLSSTSLNWMPGNNDGFAFMLLFKVAASYVNGQGWFEKCAEAAGVKTRTKGYGVYTDGTNIIAWLDDITKSTTLPLTDLPAAGEYCLMTVRYNGARIYLRLDRNVGGVPETVESFANAAATTLNATTGLSSMVVGGATDVYVAGVAAGTPGLAAMGGAVVWAALWPNYYDDGEIDAIGLTDPFVCVTLPRGTIFNGTNPLDGNHYSAYMAVAYDRLLNTTIFECQATPVDTWTQQNWLDSTMGATVTGTSAPICASQDFSNFTFIQVCDALPGAVLIPSFFFNGGGIAGGGTGQNLTDAHTKCLSLIAYWTGVTANPFATDIPANFGFTGMSSGLNVAFDLAFASNLGTWFLGRHGLVNYETDPTLIAGELTQQLETYWGLNIIYADPITITWGNALSTATGGTTAGGSSSNGRVNDWQTNSAAKAMTSLIINGATDGDNAELTTAMIPVMQAQGYNRLYQKIYNGGIHSNHGRDRDLVLQFLRNGIGSFFGTPQIISDDGDGML